MTNRLRWAVLPLLLAVAPSPAPADRLHLESGGVIEAESWWVEGDTLFYEGPAGTVGIPRSSVIRVDESDDANAGIGRAAPPDRVAGRSWNSPPASAREQWNAKAKRASKAFEMRDFETASSLLYELIGARPERGDARVLYALSEMALGRDERALDVVLDGLALEPTCSSTADVGGDESTRPPCADLYEVLGDLRNREERVEDAVRAWKDAFRLAPGDRLREKILKGERELEAARHYDYTPTTHFNLRYDRDLDPELAGAIHDFLEESYEELSDRFRHAPPQPITVLLYPDREFRQVTEAPESVAGLYDGKIRVPLGGLSRLNPRARRLLVHELTHAVVHSATRGNAPRWLHEGLAQRMEGRQLTPADRANLRSLLRSTPPEHWDRAGFSYPAALSLILFLEETWSFAALRELLETLGEGAAVDDAIREVFRDDYAALTRRWAASVLDEARP